MAKDIQDRVGQLLGSDSARALAGTAVTELLKGIGSKDDSGGNSRNGGVHPPRALSGMRGIAAGAGAAALAPVAAKGIGKLVKGNGVGSLAEAPKNLAEGAVSKVGDTVSGKVKDKVDEAGGPSGILKDTVKSALPFGGGGGGGGAKGKQDAQGVGKGRRMPIQQSVDIALPIETVYNQWTQLEEWPKFMHRVRRVSQEDPCKASFTVKIWGKTKEFTAEIETQRPDDRIKWKTSQGMNVTGVVSFRELGPNLTRVQLSFDLDPGSLVEKYARGARYAKRAARADLHRFAAFILMLENETGAWRGVIEDGEVVEDHDPKYDETREYGSADELTGDSGDEDSEDDDESDDDDEKSDEREQPRGRGRNGGDPDERKTRSSGRSRASSGGRSSGSSRGSAAQSGRSSSRTASGRSSSGGSSSGRSSSGRSSSGRSSSGRSSSSSGRSSSGRSSGSSSGGRSSSGGSSGRSSGRSSSGRSSGSSSGSSRSRTSGSSASGRKRTRSSGRS